MKLRKHPWRDTPTNILKLKLQQVNNSMDKEKCFLVRFIICMIYRRGNW